MCREGPGFSAMGGRSAPDQPNDVRGMSVSLARDIWEKKNGNHSQINQAELSIYADTI